MYQVDFVIEGMAPYSQSRMHQLPQLEKESAADYDVRTWLDKATFVDGQMHIPHMAVKQALDAVARYLSEKIKGKGNATYSKHFRSGVLLFDPLPLTSGGLPILRDGTPLVAKDGSPVMDDEGQPALVHFIQPCVINANADGVRGSGKRVMRRFPQIYPPWEAVGSLHVADYVITPELLARYLEAAGQFIGLGRFRPENGGSNGRFKVTRFDCKEEVAA